MKDSKRDRGQVNWCKPDKSAKKRKGKKNKSVAVEPVQQPVHLNVTVICTPEMAQKMMRALLGKQYENENVIDVDWEVCEDGEAQE